MITSGTYRLLVPIVDEEQEEPMDKEQGVDNSKKVMGVPKCVEACQSVEGRGEAHHILPEAVGC